MRECLFYYQECEYLVKCVVDENMPFGSDAFGTIGQVLTAGGRAIDRQMLGDVDALLVRSVTRVNRELLEGTAVRFVGTATIGFDHIDLPYLDERNIGFSSAPGSNAESVAEYILSSLLVLADRHGFDLSDKTLGVIGVGNVGSRVVRIARAAGMHVLQNDPPRQQAEGGADFVELDALLSESDIVTIHVPLTREGGHPTHHLVDETFLARLNPAAILINSSRGAVADNMLLIDALANKRLAGGVLDVWEGEPELHGELLELVEIGTPHIAGYSYDGKVNGTRMIYEAACTHFGLMATWDAAAAMPASNVPEVRLTLAGHTRQQVLSEALWAVYDIRRDDAALRATLDASASERPALFDALRKKYPVRREIAHTTARIEDAASATTTDGYDAAAVRTYLSDVGFAV